MGIERRHFLLMAAAAAACSRSRRSSPLQQAVDYLLSQQAEDGGFHSSTYGLLRSGQSLTPFVLDALLDLPAGIEIGSAVIDLGLSFIRKNTKADGTLGRMDETAADYPNYATSLAVSVLARSRKRNVKQDIVPMLTQLKSQQFSEANGWERKGAAYGGWGMGGPIHRPPDAGHVDLSMTRCVLEALRTAGIPPSDPIMERALVYLQRSQNADGGFYFSPVNPEINKAGESGEGFASYGTTTADGVLALRAAGVPETDSRIQSALQWLKNRHRPERAPGFEGTARESWGLGLRFYYAYVISRVLPSLPVQLPEQGADHSFRNSSKMVKEDDPLIATTFAVHVMTRH